MTKSGKGFGSDLWQWPCAPPWVSYCPGCSDRAMHGGNGTPTRWGAVLGYIPAGLREYAGLWKAPVADYLFGDQKASFGVEVLSYAVSGLIGLLLVGMAVYLLSKALVKHER